MRLPGHSGCKFHFNDERGIVIKSTEDSKYPTARFLRQVEKQKKFYRTHLGECKYKTPYIFGTFIQDENAYVAMELIEGCDPLEFLEAANNSQCKELFDAILGLISEYISNAFYQEVSTYKIFKKYNSVIKQLPNDQSRWLDMYWQSEFRPRERTLVLPIGDCHGDLTLSNIIICPEKLVLLDFMETYLDGPIQDIAKIRQDTHHYWTLLRYPGRILNRELVISRLKMLDQLILLSWPMIHDWQYNTFQFLNLIRILPYAKEEKVIDWVFKEIGNIT